MPWLLVRAWCKFVHSTLPLLKGWLTEYKPTEACGVCEYNSKLADTDTFCDSSAATIGSLGLGKLSSVPDMTHVEG